jgi:hypothetical protein
MVVTANKTLMDLLQTDQYIATGIHKPAVDVSTIVMEIARSREDTPECFLTFFDKNTPGLLDSAFEEECELIYFYLDAME